MSSPDDELPELEGIVASDVFRRYVADLRQTWVLKRENGPSQPKRREFDNRTMSTQPTTDCTECNERMMTRRSAMKAGAGAAVSLAAIGAGAENTAAVSGLDVEGDYLQAPFVKAAVTIANHETDFDPLDFIEDSGERDSLTNYGAEIVPREDEDEPHNPVTLMASAFDADDYSACPACRRGRRQSPDIVPVVRLESEDTIDGTPPDGTGDQEKYPDDESEQRRECLQYRAGCESK